jgi:hypothetical protein
MARGDVEVGDMPSWGDGPGQRLADEAGAAAGIEALAARLQGLGVNGSLDGGLAQGKEYLVQCLSSNNRSDSATSRRRLRLRMITTVSPVW